MSIVVSGVATGIGQAVALQLASAGHALVRVDIDGDGLAQTAATLPAATTCRLIHGSVANTVTAGKAATAAQALGGAQGLSHNAGIQRYGSALDTRRNAGTKSSRSTCGPPFCSARPCCRS